MENKNIFTVPIYTTRHNHFVSIYIAPERAPISQSLLCVCVGTIPFSSFFFPGSFILLDDAAEKEWARERKKKKKKKVHIGGPRQFNLHKKENGEGGH